MLKVIEKSDTEYTEWLRQNPTGWVVNTSRSRRASYMVLHRATCFTISPDTGTTDPGGFTERSYIKICANDINELREWARQNGRKDGSFSAECSKCC